jgi:hypothetical protein
MKMGKFIIYTVFFFSGSYINSYLLQLMLIKRGGQIIYSGELGQNSSKLIDYLEVRLLFILNS